MHILTILVYPLKIYLSGNRFFKSQASLNLICMNLSLTEKEYSFPL